MVCAGAYAPAHTIFREFLTKSEQILTKIEKISAPLFAAFSGPIRDLMNLVSNSDGSCTAIGFSTKQLDK